MSAHQKNIPAVGRVINEKIFAPWIDLLGRELVTNIIRKRCEDFRAEVDGSNSYAFFLNDIESSLKKYSGPSLKEVINATGVVVHTNLGRSPLGEELLQELKAMSNYNNLEFDLETGKRGNRQDHLKKELCLLTGAEDAIVVNNNAAALVLILGTFAKNREVVVSRGELIEIGDSFRIPDIMETGGARLVEVGSTNKTKLNDYQQAIGCETAILFKAHTSNFVISGFTESVCAKDMAELARSNKIISVYDLGSGMLTKVEGSKIDGPTVKEAIDQGVDLVTFSGDKLLGGPQSGVIVGKKELIAQLSKHPLMRALRPGKLTIYALIIAVRNYFSEKSLYSKNLVFKMVALGECELFERAQLLKNELKIVDIDAEIEKSDNYVGGGAAPELKLLGVAVKLLVKNPSKLYRDLMRGEFGTPIVGLLKEGKLFLELRTIPENKIEMIARTVSEVEKKVE